MKKLLSIILAAVLVFSVVPAVVFESSAAAGSLPLDLDVSVTTSAGEWVVNTFRPTEDGIYIFSSSGSLDTLGYIALEEGEAENQYIKDDGGQGNNFAVTYNMRAGVTYYLGSTLLTGSGTYTVKIIKFEIDDHSITDISASVNTAVSMKKANGTKFFSFVPSVSGKFVYCSSGNFDTQGYIFDDSWSQIAYDDDNGSVQNFEMTLDLQAGKTYYLGCSTASVSTANFNVLIYQKNRISSVSVDTPPDQTTYYKGLDATPVSGGKYHVNLILFGFKFSVNYANGSSEVRKYTYSVRGVECETSRDLNSGANAVGSYYENLLLIDTHNNGKSAVEREYSEAFQIEKSGKSGAQLLDMRNRTVEATGKLRTDWFVYTLASVKHGLYFSGRDYSQNLDTPNYDLCKFASGERKILAKNVNSSWLGFSDGGIYYLKQGGSAFNSICLKAGKHKKTASVVGKAGETKIKEGYAFSDMKLINLFSGEITPLNFKKVYDFSAKGADIVIVGKEENREGKSFKVQKIMYISSESTKVLFANNIMDETTSCELGAQSLITEKDGKTHIISLELIS